MTESDSQLEPSCLRQTLKLNMLTQQPHNPAENFPKPWDPLSNNTNPQLNKTTVKTAAAAEHGLEADSNDDEADSVHEGDSDDEEDEEQQESTASKSSRNPSGRRANAGRSSLSQSSMALVMAFVCPRKDPVRCEGVFMSQEQQEADSYGYREHDKVLHLLHLRNIIFVGTDHSARPFPDQWMNQISVQEVEKIET